MIKMKLPDWINFEIPTYFWYSLGPLIAILAYIYNFYVRMTNGKFKEEVGRISK
jgi:hypothetical protein